MTGGMLVQRLDRILSEAGAASRSELRAIIRAGRVAVDGRTVRDERAKYDETAVRITLDGAPVRLRGRVLLMLNKPAGYLTAADDPHAPTVMELIPEQYRKLGVMPVGRLDKQTEGLLLFTNDGTLAHRLISPKSGIWKQYYAEHEGSASERDAEAFAKGLLLEDGTRCLPARLTALAAGASLIEVQEGKYHQVRRMMAARGMPVGYLRRLREGSIELGDLAPGDVRELDIAQAERDLERAAPKE